jgi:hypothetical protein
METDSYVRFHLFCLVLCFAQKYADHREKLTREVTLFVYITHQGFYVYANGRFDVFFPHRRDIEAYNGKDLKIWFTYRDENGHPHEVTVRKVFWEETNLEQFYNAQSDLVKGDVYSKLRAPKPKCVLNPYAPRTVLISGLPVMDDLKKIQVIEVNLFAVFEGVSAMSLLPGTQYAFARVRIFTLFVVFMLSVNDCCGGGVIVEITGFSCQFHRRKRRIDGNVTRWEAVHVAHASNGSTPFNRRVLSS